MSKLRQYDSNGHHTQSIFVSIHIAGDQHVQVDSHGGRGLGSNIAVLADHTSPSTTSAPWAPTPTPGPRAGTSPTSASPNKQIRYPATSPMHRG